MDGPEDIWLNPIIQLPTSIAALVLIAIALLSFWNLRTGIATLLATVPLQRFIVISGVLGDRFTPHEAAFICTIAAAIVRRDDNFKLTAPWTGPLAAPMFCLLAVGVISLVGNPFIDVGLTEIVILLYVFLLMRLVYDFARVRAYSLFAFHAWYLTAAVFAVLAGTGGILHVLGVETFLMSGPRLVCTFFNANQTGAFILAGSFLFLARATRAQASRWKKVVDLTLVMLAVTAGYFTASRATVLGAGAGLVMFLALRRVRISALLALSALLVVGNYALSFLQETNRESADMLSRRYNDGVDLDSESAKARFENWQSGLEAFATSPAVGIGIGTLYLQTLPTSGESYQVHNTYLAILGETGLLGFFAFIVIIVLLVRTSSQSVQLARGTPFEDPVIGLVSALVALGVFNVFHYGIRARYLWVTIAFVFAFRRVLLEERAVAAAESAPKAGPRLFSRFERPVGAP